MAYLPLPDGSYLTIKENETDEQAWERAKRTYPQLFADPSKAKEGFAANLGAAAKEFVGSSATGIASFADPELARRMARANEAQQIEAAKAVEWGNVKEAMAADPVSGIGTLGAFARDTIARSLPQMGAVIAGGAGGAALGSLAGPIGTAVGGAAGAVAAGFPAFQGQNIARQVQEQEAKGAEAPLDVGSAALSSAGQSALDAASTLFVIGKLGKGVLSGKSVNALLKKPAAEIEAELVKKAERSVLGSVARGAGEVAAVEIPTEVAQQILERAQAGLPLLDADARREYESVAAGAAVIAGPLGGLGGGVSRRSAISNLGEIQKARAIEEQQKAAEAQRKAEAQALTAEEAKITPLDAWLEQQGLGDMEVRPPVGPTSIEEAGMEAAARPAPLPMAPLQKKVTDAVQGVQYWAEQQSTAATPEDIAGQLARDPNLAYAVLQGNAIVPGVDARTRKEIDTLLKQQVFVGGKRVGNVLAQGEREAFRQQLEEEKPQPPFQFPIEEAPRPRPVLPITPAPEPQVKASDVALEAAFPGAIEKPQLQIEEQSLADSRKKLLGQLNEYVDNLTVLKEPMTVGRKNEMRMQVDRISDLLAQNVLDQINASRELNGYGALGWEGAADLAKNIRERVKRAAFGKGGDKAPGTAERIEIHRVREMQDKLMAMREKLASNAVYGRQNILAPRNRDIDRIDKQLARLRDISLESAKQEDINSWLQGIIDEGTFAGERQRLEGTGAPAQRVQAPFEFGAPSRELARTPVEETARRIRRAQLEGGDVARLRLMEQLKSATTPMQRAQTMGEVAATAQEQIAGETAQGDLFGPLNRLRRIYSGPKKEKAALTPTAEPISYTPITKGVEELRGELDILKKEEEKAVAENAYYFKFGRVNEAQEALAATGALPGEIPRVVRRNTAGGSKQQAEEAIRSGFRVRRAQLHERMRNAAKQAKLSKPTPEPKEVSDAAYDLAVVKANRESILGLHSDVLAARGAERDARNTLKHATQKLENISKGRGEEFKTAKDAVDKAKRDLNVMLVREDELEKAIFAGENKARVQMRLRDRIKKQQKTVKDRKDALAAREKITWPQWVKEVEGAVNAVETAEKDMDAAIDGVIKADTRYRKAKDAIPSAQRETELTQRLEAAQRAAEKQRPASEEAQAAARRAVKSAQETIESQKTLEEREKTDIKVEGKQYTGKEYAEAEAAKEAALRVAASKVRRGAGQTGQTVEQYIEGLDAAQWQELVDASKAKVQKSIDKTGSASADPANWAARVGVATRSALEDLIRKGRVPSVKDMNWGHLARVMARQAELTDIRPHRGSGRAFRSGEPESRAAEKAQRAPVSVPIKGGRVRVKERPELKKTAGVWAKNSKIMLERLKKQEEKESKILGDTLDDETVFGPDEAPRASTSSTAELIAAARAAPAKSTRKGKELDAMFDEYQAENLAVGRDDRTVVSKYHGKSFSEVARDLEKTLLSPNLKAVAARIADVFKKGGNKGEVIVSSNTKNVYSPSFYSPANNVVVLRSSDPYVALHELAHAATMYGIQNNMKLRADIANLRYRVATYARTPEGRKLREELFPLYDESQYGLTNELEFAAEALANGEFQQFLSRIPSNQPKKNLWNRFVEAIVNFLGLKGDQQTALHDALTLIDRSMEETQAILEADKGTGTGVSFSPPKFDPAYQEYQALHEALNGKEKDFRERIIGDTIGLRLRTKFLDNLAPAQALNDTHQGRLEDQVAGGNMMYTTRKYNQKNALVAQAAATGPLKLSKDASGRITFGATEGASLVKLSQLIGKQKEGGDHNARAAMFDVYRKALRAQEVGWDALNSDLTDQQRALGDKLVKNPLPWFKEADEIYNAFNKGLIDFNIATGALPKELGERLNKMSYVPYYREDKGEILLDLDAGPPIRVGNIKDQPYLRELVGGNSATLDFWAATLRNTAILTDLALRNLATRNTAFALKQFGLGQFVGENVKGEDVIRFRIDGEDKAFRVDSEAAGVPSNLLVKGLEGVSVAMPDVVRLMGVPANLLRRMVTLNPVYVGKQLVRDSLMTSIAGGADFKPIISSGAEYLKSLRGTQNKLLEQRGIVGGNVFSHDMFDNERLLKEISSGKTGWGTLMAKTTYLSMEADAATRRAAYSSYLKQGLSDQEAELATLEAMNFSRRGTSASMKMLGTMVPFMNAQIQGLDALYRAFRGKMPFDQKLNIKKKLYKRGLMLAGLSMAYALAMQDDEAYQNASIEDRLNNWFVYVPGLDEPAKIPIPFELGYIFKAIPEMLVNGMSENTDSDELLRGFSSLAWMSVPNFMIPHGIKPSLEVFVNKSFYNNAQIETDMEQQVDRSQRFTDRTSEVAKALAFDFELFGQHMGVSPKQLEYLVRGYTAGLGTAVFKALDLFLPTDTPKPEKLASEIPILGTALQPVDSLGRMNALYKELEKYERSKATLEKLIEEGKEAEAEKYLERNEGSIVRADVARQARKAIGEFREQERLIRTDKEMTPESKRTELTALRKEQIEFMKGIREALREGE